MAPKVELCEVNGCVFMAVKAGRCPSHAQADDDNRLMQKLKKRSLKPWHGSPLSPGIVMLPRHTVLKLRMAIGRLSVQERQALTQGAVSFLPQAAPWVVDGRPDRQAIHAARKIMADQYRIAGRW